MFIDFLFLSIVYCAALILGLTLWMVIAHSARSTYGVHARRRILRRLLDNYLMQFLQLERQAAESSRVRDPFAEPALVEAWAMLTELWAVAAHVENLTEDGSPKSLRKAMRILHFVVQSAREADNEVRAAPAAKIAQINWQDRLEHLTDVFWHGVELGTEGGVRLSDNMSPAVAEAR